MPQENHLNSISFIDTTMGMAVGNAGAVIRTTDGGVTWNNLNTGYIDNCYSVYLKDRNNAYIGVAGNYILTTSNGGDNWVRYANGGLYNGVVNSIYFITENIGFAVGQYANDLHGVIYKTTDRGQHWTILKTIIYNKMKKVTFTNDSTGYVIGDGALIFKTTNAGNNWTNQISPINQVLYDITFYNKNIGYIAGGGGTILKTTNSGINWTVIYSGNPYNQELRSISILDSFNIVVTGDRFDNLPILLYTTDGGMNWINYNYEGSLKAIKSLCKFNNNICYGSSLYGLIYKFSKIDRSLVLTNSLTDFDLRFIDFASDRVGYICGNAGTILKTTNYGSNWIKLNSNVNFDLYCIKTFDEENLLACGNNNSFILKSTNGGLNFINIYDSLSQNWFVYLNIVKNPGIGSYTCYMLGQSLWHEFHSNSVAKSTNLGNTWTNVFSDENWYSSMFFINQNTGYISGDAEGNQKTINGGLTWQFQTVTPIGLGGHPIFFPSTDTGYVIGLVVRKTLNGGNSWFTSDSSFSPPNRGIYFRGNNNGILCGDGSRIYYTTNGGSHWESSRNDRMFNRLNSIIVTSNNKGFCVGEQGTIIYNNNSFIVNIQDPSNLAIRDFKLYQNYPNPFNPITKINFDLPKENKINLIVYDLLGREIVKLINNELRVAGRYTIEFDGSNLPSGVYFYRLETTGENKFSLTKRMVLIK